MQRLAKPLPSSIFSQSSSIGEKSVWNEARIQSCYVTVHVTCTCALEIADARTLKTAVPLEQRRLATRHHSRDIPKVSAHVTIDLKTVKMKAPRVLMPR